MTKKLSTDVLLVEDILVAITDIEAAAPYIDNSRPHLLAAAYSFIAMGEAAKRMSKAMHEKYPHIPWREIMDLRNRMAHGYDDIHVSKLSGIIENEIPRLQVDLEKILKEIDQ